MGPPEYSARPDPGPVESGRRGGMSPAMLEDALAWDEVEAANPPGTTPQEIRRQVDALLAKRREAS